ncbi:protein MCM10 homolog [Culicoides brevitarsis]|uniref:protein MCM10 homolog n=1 Tax=Culicoides brevitarsis TaxID=469753 RepID=UPI00307BF7D3
MENNDTKALNEEHDPELDELEQIFLDEEATSSSTVATKANSSDIEREKVLLDLLSEEAKETKSLVHDPDRDSSDDEDVRNFLEQKYNEYGRDISASLKKKEEEQKDRRISHEVTTALKTGTTSRVGVIGPSNSFKQKATTSTDTKPAPITKFFEKTTIYTDPVFGMRIKQPLISSAMLVERMQNRTPVSFARIRYHTEQGGDLSKDWVVAGAIISKAVKESKKGAKFSIWKLSDLRPGMKIVTVFLFKAAHNELWKTPEGMVIGILNPGVLERKDENKEEAVLSVDNAQKIMLLGQSRDLGKCRSKTKNGEQCQSIVNLTDCEYCVFHVKQEYSKASKRSDIQSSTAGRGLNELRNKILGKNEVFYGGQSFSAIPAKKNAKQVAKDQHRLMTLSEYYQSPNGPTPRAPTSVPDATSKPKSRLGAERHEIDVKQRKRDLERLALLGGPSELNLSSTSLSSPQSHNSPKINTLASKTATQTPPPPAPDSWKNQKTQELLFSSQKRQLAAPKLSSGNFTVDLSMSSKQAMIAKQHAINLLKNKPIEKANPNFIKHRGTEAGKKRALEELDQNLTGLEQDVKKQKIDKANEENAKRERLLRIMNATSSHNDILEVKELERQDKYFTNLEKKEAMEEKMLNTTKVACKAVICLTCKYVALSAADRCKEERHPLKIREAEKRFFKCHDCGYRTISLHRIPKLACKICSSSRWDRTSMMPEKTVKVGEQLSIRGDEETFIGNISGSANLNLLVPDN